ncbi:MAG: ABC transporter permease [Dehalococcoidia bacterium]
MTSYLFQRVLWIIPVLLAIAVVTFVLMHAVPGGPCHSTKPAPPEAIANCEAHYGLNQPAWKQLGHYLIDLGQGDLGLSLERNRAVSDVLADGTRVSATLGLIALVLSVTAGVALGVVSALRQNSAVDYAAVGFATAAASLPSFILGMLLLVLFVGELHWLPPGGWGSPKQAVLPVLALSVLPTAYIARVTRASMLDVLRDDYIRTARAKGLHEQTVVLRHMLRNALVPVLTVIGPLAAALITGSFIIEHLFAIPGIGRTFVDSIAERDYNVIMGTTLFYTVVVAIANLAVDVLYAFINPKIRYESYG